MKPSKLQFALTTILLVAAVGFTVAAAQSDGQKEQKTNAGICDDLKEAGVTPGLYNLCEDFWDPQDCGREDPLSDTCTAASPEILQQYTEAKKPKDPEMPGVQQPCPCWSVDELDALQDSNLEFCINEENSQRQEFGYGAYLENGLRAVGVHRDMESQIYTCRYVDETAEPHTVRSMFVGSEEFASCREQIEDRGELFGNCFGALH